MPNFWSVVYTCLAIGKRLILDGKHVKYQKVSYLSYLALFANPVASLVAISELLKAE